MSDNRVVQLPAMELGQLRFELSPQAQACLMAAFQARFGYWILVVRPFVELARRKEAEMFVIKGVTFDNKISIYEVQTIVPEMNAFIDGFCVAAGLHPLPDHSCEAL